MEALQENKKGYASDSQRKILLGLLDNRTVQDVFFLTGGTALAVFYLGHRISDDIDLFSTESIAMPEVDFWIKTRWGARCSVLQKSRQFLSLLIDGVKVDLVLDPLSFKGKRPRFHFDPQRSIQIDDLFNIATNKLTAIVSRTEPKDFVDFYLLLQHFPGLELQELYDKSRLKEAIFDDPPTAAFQMETGLSFVRENPALRPKMIRELEWADLHSFYEKLTRWIYSLAKP